MSHNEVEQRSYISHGPEAWFLSGLCVSTNLMTGGSRNVLEKQNLNVEIPSDAPHNIVPSPPPPPKSPQSSVSGTDILRHVKETSVRPAQWIVRPVN